MSLGLLIMSRRLSTCESGEIELSVQYKRSFVHSTMGASMLQLAYGYRPQNSHDRFFNNARRVAGMVATAVMPTSMLYPPSDHIERAR